jgi:hypothetical protein
MSSFTPKVFIVQQADENGKLGEILAVKLTFGAAHSIAKANAPAKVLFGMADKTEAPNPPGQYRDQGICH